MNQLSLLNIIIALAATGACVLILVWLFAAPVKKSDARGQGMKVGTLLHYFFGGRGGEEG